MFYQKNYSSRFFIVSVLILVFFTSNILKYVKSKEKYNNIQIEIQRCRGRRDGYSGCRTCCQQFTGSQYQECVNDCMRF
jgi:hypothetical protein